MAVSQSWLLCMLPPSLQGRLPACANCSLHIASKSQTDGANRNVFFPPFNALCIMASPKIVSENELIAGPFDSPNLLMRSTLSCQSERCKLPLCDHTGQSQDESDTAWVTSLLSLSINSTAACSGFPQHCSPRSSSLTCSSNPGKQPLFQNDSSSCLTATDTPGLTGCLTLQSTVWTRDGLLCEQGSWNGE